MPTKVVEQIKEKARVAYRSSEIVTKREALISMAADLKTLVVRFKLEEKKGKGKEDPEEEVDVGIRIPVLGIANVKVKTLYDNNDGHLWNLSVVMTKQSQGDQVHHSFQFEKETIRDMWDSGLRSLVFKATGGHSQGSGTNENAGADENSLHTILAVRLKSPEPNILVCIAIRFTKLDEEAYLEVPKDAATPEDCKMLTEAFLKKYSVSPTHSTSLYRLVRAVTSRALLEQETHAVLAEIDAASTDTICEDLANREKSPKERAEACLKAQEHLDELIASLPQRMGQSGPAASLVRDMLKRNAQKMKLINEALIPRRC